jgi:hypothetical protein
MSYKAGRDGDIGEIIVHSTLRLITTRRRRAASRRPCFDHGYRKRDANAIGMSPGDTAHARSRWRL